MNLLNLCVCVCAALISVSRADIFSSSMKVERLAKEEGAVLEELKRYIDTQYDRLKSFTNFYTDRLKEVSRRGGGRMFDDLEHPNAVYRTIKRFSSDYANILGENFESFRRSIATSEIPFEADLGDIRGATLSILRLQHVYKLKASDMAAGVYLGFQGPPLTAQDTYEIGQLAFTESMLKESIEWLNMTLTLLSQPSDSWRALRVEEVKALMGRVHLYSGDVPTAKILYDGVKHAESTVGDAVELGKELEFAPRAEVKEEKDYFQNFSRLCSLENRHHVPNPGHPSMICRYKQALLPWYRFKEEILSVSPYVSVIYNVTTESDTNFLKDRVENALVRGEVGADDDSSVSDVRTGDLAWIWDHDDTMADDLSLKVKHITGLEVEQNHPDGPASAEAFQVVNYGLGGHYEVHMDPFDNGSSVPILQESGDRIATFLMYLSDVTRGGSTVFTQADIAVAPIKHMALFWYNFSPAYVMDEMTHHAGCPILIGHKWIANKWIWTVRNTFRRRCGLTPDATQLDIEADMESGYR